jgi:hypothetical protein
VALQVSVIGSGSEWGESAEEVGRLLAERLGRRVVALAGAPAVEGIAVASSPLETVDLALRDLE